MAQGFLELFPKNLLTNVFLICYHAIMTRQQIFSLFVLSLKPPLCSG